MNSIISKYKSYAAAALLGLSLTMTTSCTDYLDKAPESDVSAKDAFKNFTNFQGFAEELYLCMPDFTRGYWTTSWNWGEDDIMAVGINYHMSYKVDQGDFWGWQRNFDGWGSGFFEPDATFDPNDRFKRGLWPAAWYGIRKCNIGLANMELMTDATPEEKNMVKGQLLFFRGWLHFMLVQYFGGLPYIDRDLTGEPLTLPRETYQECADKIAADFRAAADLLPIDWDQTQAGRNTLGKNGLRINKITALAYLGKNYLWAASPLMKNTDAKMNVTNPNASTYEYDQAYAQKAADALGELLALVEGGQTQYKLVDFSEYHDLFYTWNRNMLLPGGTESILRAIAADAWQNTQYGVFTEFGGQILTGGQSFSMPTANYVNYYGMKNGLPLNDPESGFDPTHPWKDRDPRFYTDIVYDGLKMVDGDINPEANRYANMYTGGSYRDETNESRTGYFLQKFSPGLGNTVDYASTYMKIYVDCPYMRLADCYLMYAEALAAVGGAGSKSSKCALTAEGAINKIRERAGVSPVAAKNTADKAKFMDEVRRERAVELAFEGHRFNDLRRWLLLDKSPYNIKTSQEFVRSGEFNTSDPTQNAVGSWSEKQILKRNFTSKHWWFPLKTKDTSMYPEMFQNPGW